MFLDSGRILLQTKICGILLSLRDYMLFSLRWLQKNKKRIEEERWEKNKKGRVRIMSRGTCLEEESGLGRRQCTLKFRVNGCEKGQLGSEKGEELSWGPHPISCQTN